jgi:glycosyltransferase involved in cell wall biosynthesis
MKPGIDASVVICAYSSERWTDLVAAVGSVRSQTFKAYEIILVIDRNDDLLLRAAGEFADLQVVPNHRQPGISGARNTGIAVAGGEIVVFLDDDAIAESDWLARLSAPFDDQHVLGVGGEIIPLWRFGRPDWFPAEFNWVVGCSYVGLPKRRAKVRNPIGASLSARRSVLEALGGFDHSMGRVSAENHEQISGTADETELCIRATKLWPDGYWLYEPAARVHHVVPRSRLSWRFFVGRCQMEGGAKARLTLIAGPHASLVSERTYVARVLPAAIARELRTALKGDPAGWRRAGAILAGVTITGLTYLRVRLAARATSSRRHADR